MNRLSLSIYPRRNGTACLMLKDALHLYRINHLFNYQYFTSQLEAICSRLGKGLYHKECLDIFDKKNRHWVLLCSCADRKAALALWFVSSEAMHMHAKFNWSGAVSVLTEAVRRLVQRLY